MLVFCPWKAVYPMGILWIWYGYPMVLVRNWHEFGTILEQCGHCIPVEYVQRRGCEAMLSV